jgi:hypothetical protein
MTYAQNLLLQSFDVINCLIQNEDDNAETEIRWNIVQAHDCRHSEKG